MKLKLTMVASLLVALAGGIGAAGCGDDECSRSGDRLAECFPDPSEYTSSFDGTQTCDATNLCIAKCVNAADCTTIREAYSGMPADKARPFLQCTAACQTAPQ